MIVWLDDTLGIRPDGRQQQDHNRRPRSTSGVCRKHNCRNRTSHAQVHQPVLVAPVAALADRIGR